MHLSRSWWAVPLMIVALSGCTEKVANPVDIADTTHFFGEFRVSPSALNVAVGGTARLSALSESNVALPISAVTWHSSNDSIATVTANGTVTGLRAGNATVVAQSVSDPTEKGAAAVTVGITGPLGTIGIAGINTTNGAGQSVPANLAAIGGIIDVLVTLSADSAAMTVVATIKSGTDSLVQTKTLAANTKASNLSPLIFTMNTAQTSAAGAPVLHNGAAILSLTATATSTPPKSVKETLTFTLTNPGGG